MKPESRKNTVEVEIHMTVSLEARNFLKITKILSLILCIAV